MINNYYEAIAALGLKEGASKEEAKDAFRSLSKIYHPDLYKKDSGEAFKKINQAYQYLKRYPEAPTIQTSYTRPSSNNGTYSPNYHQSERARRTERNMANRRREVRERAAYYAALFYKARWLVLFVFVLNSLLALDYMLPRAKNTSKIASFKKHRSSLKNSGRTYLKVVFEDGTNYNLYSVATMSKDVDDFVYSYEKTLLFRQQMSITNVDREFTSSPGYNVFKVFGFIIIIQFLCLLRYKVVSGSQAKIHTLVTMTFLVIIQVALLCIN